MGYRLIWRDSERTCILFFFLITQGFIPAESCQQFCASHNASRTQAGTHGADCVCVVSSFLCRYMKRLRLPLHQITKHWGISSHFVAQIWASAWLLKGEGFLTVCDQLANGTSGKNTVHTHTHTCNIKGEASCCLFVLACQQVHNLGGLKQTTEANQRNHLLLLLSIINLSLFFWVEVMCTSQLCTQLNNLDYKKSSWKLSSSCEWLFTCSIH